jgi:hypothetical protein
MIIFASHLILIFSSFFLLLPNLFPPNKIVCPTRGGLFPPLQKKCGDIFGTIGPRPKDTRKLKQMAVQCTGGGGGAPPASSSKTSKSRFVRAALNFRDFIALSQTQNKGKGCDQPTNQPSLGGTETL